MLRRRATSTATSPKSPVTEAEIQDKLAVLARRIGADYTVVPTSHKTNGSVSITHDNDIFRDRHAIGFELA